MIRAYLEKEVPLIRLQPSNVFNEVKRRQDLLLRLQNHRRVGVSAGNLKHPCRMRLKWQLKLCCRLGMCKRCLQSEKSLKVLWKLTWLDPAAEDGCCTVEGAMACVDGCCGPAVPTVGPPPAAVAVASGSTTVILRSWSLPCTFTWLFEMCFQFRAFIGAMNMMISTQSSENMVLSSELWEGFFFCFFFGFLSQIQICRWLGLVFLTQWVFLPILKLLDAVVVPDCSERDEMYVDLVANKSTG